MPFISVSWLITPARPCSSMLNRNCENGHTNLFPDVRRKAFNLWPLSIMSAVGLSYMTFVMLRYVPSIPNFFYHEKMLYLSNAFSASIEVIVWFLSFILLIWCHIYWFAHVEYSLQPKKKSHLIVMYDSFNVLLNLVH